MDQPALFDLKILAAEEALMIGNEGKARVYARRAVALADDAWAPKRSAQTFRGDALAHLRRIQQDPFIKLFVLRTAERSSTTVTSNDSTPLRTDPIGHPGMIIVYLIAV